MQSNSLSTYLKLYFQRRCLHVSLEVGVIYDPICWEQILRICVHQHELATYNVTNDHRYVQTKLLYNVLYAVILCTQNVYLTKKSSTHFILLIMESINVLKIRFRIDFLGLYWIIPAFIFEHFLLQSKISNKKLQI